MQVGITGGIGSGKSIVSRILSHKGYPVFNSDEQAKWLINNSQTLQNSIAQLLGKEAFLNGQYNRPFVAQKVFNDDALRIQLNELVHPAVRQAFQDFAQNHANTIVFNEAAILFETDAYKQFDATILICAPEELRVQRVAQRDGVSENDVLQRMRKQWTDEQKMKLTKLVIHNDGQQSVLLQLAKILRQLT